jgi:hypothetical protein
MKYGLVYLMGGDWGLVTNTIEGGNFVAKNVIDALNVVAEWGWEFVSQIDYYQADDGKAYVVRKNDNQDRKDKLLQEMDNVYQNEYVKNGSGDVEFEFFSYKLGELYLKYINDK